MSKVLLIIGNGFDLSLGLDTSYQSFLKSQEFYNIGTYTLSSYLEQKQKIQNWVDIEKELANYCLDLYKIKHNPQARNPLPELKDDYRALCTQLKKYLRKEELKLTSVNKGAYPVQLLQDLSKKQIEPLDVITFNYTDTLDRISRYLLNVSKPNVYHVHGSLKTDIVFGVDDKSDLHKEEMFLYKSYSPFKQIRPIKRLLDTYNNIIFFGYSLGDTDRQYFQDYFYDLGAGRKEEHNIAIYYYGEGAYSEVKWQLQNYTVHNLSGLEMNNNIEYIDSSEEYRGLPEFLK